MLDPQSIAAKPQLSIEPQKIQKQSARDFYVLLWFRKILNQTNLANRSAAAAKVLSFLAKHNRITLSPGGLE